MRVLSIGTGLGDDVTIDNTRLSIITGLKKMATSSKKVAARLDTQYGDSAQYYRFNVDQGLQDIKLSDWEQASNISARTRNYLGENQRTIKKFVNDFTSMVQAGEGHGGETSQTKRSETHDGDETSPPEIMLTTSRIKTQRVAVAVGLRGAPNSQYKSPKRIHNGH
jgi:hypothetical protein